MFVLINDEVIITYLLKYQLIDSLFIIKINVNINFFII